jgi:hypothetical protein
VRRNSSSDPKVLAATWLDLGLIDNQEADKLLRVLGPLELSQVSLTQHQPGVTLRVEYSSVTVQHLFFA